MAASMLIVVIIGVIVVGIGVGLVMKSGNRGE
jgi:hypothetical protein